MVIKYEKSDSVQLSKNFRLGEFKCKCGKCASVLVDTDLVDILQQIRDHFGKPVNINSGYRCKTHNANVGGDPNSSHMQGMAADIVVKDVSPREVAKYAESIGVKRIGLYENKDGNFVHIGSGTTKRFWLGHAGTPVDSFNEEKVKTVSVTLPVLKRGMKNDTVVALQLLLQGHTNPRLSADGSFGPATELEVKEYQRKVNLDDDGHVGSATWKKLLGVK